MFSCLKFTSFQLVSPKSWLITFINLVFSIIKNLMDPIVTKLNPLIHLHHLPLLHPILIFISIFVSFIYICSIFIIFLVPTKLLISILLLLQNDRQ